jgi:hypothetical protein
VSARIGAAPAEAVQSPFAAIMVEARRIARPVIVYSIVDSNSHIVRDGTGLRRLHCDQPSTMACVPEFDSLCERLDQDRAMEHEVEQQ